MPWPSNSLEQYQNLNGHPFKAHQPRSSIAEGEGLYRSVYPSIYLMMWLSHSGEVTVLEGDPDLGPVVDLLGVADLRNEELDPGPDLDLQNSGESHL